MRVTLRHSTVDVVASVCAHIFRAFGWEWITGVPGHSEIVSTISELTENTRKSDKDSHGWETGRILVRRSYDELSNSYDVYVNVGTVEVMEENKDA